MLFLKRGLMAAGALALAAMLLNFVAPRAAHAVVATAVQVMNTSATPVPTRDVDAAGRSAYTIECHSAGASCSTAVVPSGYTFVLDSISFYANYAPPLPAVTGCTMALAPAAPTQNVYRLTLTPDLYGGAYAATNLTAYVNGGSSIFLGCWPSPYEVNGVFAGHLVSTP